MVKEMKRREGDKARSHEAKIRRRLRQKLKRHIFSFLPSFFFFFFGGGVGRIDIFEKAKFLA